MIPYLSGLVEQRRKQYIETHPESPDLWDTFSNDKLLLEAAEELADAWQYMNQLYKRVNTNYVMDILSAIEDAYGYLENY
ncbi:hypothetical protein HYZ97_00975 [Candidatus Pacearchaeota archaeon]|nr:hypothetical protein [Candidatus Pacearchaeota archaeon]